MSLRAHLRHIYYFVGDYHPPDVQPPPQITFDYQSFVFNATHRTIAWRFINDQSCTPPITFTIQSFSCDTGNPISTWTTVHLAYTLPLSAFLNDRNEPLHFSITASDTHAVECTSLPGYFQVYPNGKLVDLP